MIEKIASRLSRKDEEPNIELALEILTLKGRGIDELVQHLDDRDTKVANDCMKVLYEVGKREPALIADYTKKFIDLLKSKNNRLVWGSMMSLSQVASFKPDVIFENWETVKKAYEKGSVITVDYSISLFAELIKQGEKYEKVLFPLIIEHLKTCRPKEVPQHAERAFVCVRSHNSVAFVQALNSRYPSLSDSQKKRIDKIIKKIN